MRTVIITGASGNLGLVVTNRFLDSGYRVIATVANEASKKELPAHGLLSAEIVNLTDEAETASFVAATIDKYQRVDAALLLVGGFAMGNIAVTGGSELKKQYALNFETAYYITRPLFAHMVEQGAGRIVFIGSRPSLAAGQGKDLLAYGLSKSLL
ncbi:MAG TPA: SDR family NAD(P)-dependent oxidoreductase, partial [Puia sp.]|nr:SDR family NAD(P)-dependent oxidoreductase [Puia sp.]